MIRFEDLVDKVRGIHPEADIELLRRAYVFSAFEHKGQVRHSGEPYLVHPARGGRPPRRHEARRRRHRRRPAARHRRGHADPDRAHPGALRRRRRPRRRGRDQAGGDPVFVERGAAGGELPQDAAGDGRRHPGHPGQARRPPPQHADAAPPAGGAADQDRAGDARHLRPDRQPARHEQDQERARGAGVQAPRAAALRVAPRRASRAGAAPTRG